MASSELDRFHAALRAARARVDPLLVTPEDGGEAASGALAELKVALDGLDAAEGLLACADPTRPTAGDGRSQRYRELFDRAPAAYVVTDSDGVITEVNRTARDLFGPDRGDPLGRSLALLVDARDRGQLRTTVTRLAADGGARQWVLRLDDRPAARAGVAVAASAGRTADDEPELRWIIQPTAIQRGREALAVAVHDLTVLLARTSDVDEVLATLCDHGAEIVDAASCGVLLADEAGRLQTVAASDQRTEALELFQMQHAQGPCFDAFHADTIIMEADLSRHGDTWPGFVARARARGLRAVLAVPMRVGDMTIGGLNFLRTRTGPFRDSDVLAAEALANFAAFGIACGRALGHTQATVEQLRHALHSRIIIEQAKGMLAERAGVSTSVAFTSLRSHARNHNCKLHAVCRAFVEGRLPLDELAIREP